MKFNLAGSWTYAPTVLDRSFTLPAGFKFGLGGAWSMTDLPTDKTFDGRAGFKFGLGGSWTFDNAPTDGSFTLPAGFKFGLGGSWAYEFAAPVWTAPGTIEDTIGNPHAFGPGDADSISLAFSPTSALTVTIDWGGAGFEFSSHAGLTLVSGSFGPDTHVTATGTVTAWNTAFADFTAILGATPPDTMTLTAEDGVHAPVAHNIVWDVPASPPPPPPAIIDNFTDANGTGIGSHTGDGGVTWTVVGSVDGAIQDNRYYQASSTGFLYSSWVPTDADYTVRGVFRKVSAAGYGDLLGRCDTSGGFTYYLAEFEGSSGNFDLYRRNGGTYTHMGTTYNESITNGTDFTMDLVMAGTSISLYVNGTLRVSATDGSITATGAPGLRSSGNSSSTGIHLDSIELIN